MFDRAGLIAACEAHGRVIRVVVAAVHGSTPREVGAAMLVWADGQSGTIGGGALEYQLAKSARHLHKDSLSRHALGPDMGQCCGGAVEVLSEIYDLKRAQALPEDVIARGSGDMPLGVTRLLRTARGQGTLPLAQLVDGWMVEPVAATPHHLWIWGAGHVGRALVDVVHKMPGVAVTWVDTAPDRFPADIPQAVTCVPAADPAVLAPHAPRDAHHLILTYSHDLDLALCHALLSHSFDTCGLIGSATKWARFRKRLAALGHTPAQIARITCPIGDPALGKHPHMIAVGVAHRLALSLQSEKRPMERRA
ncbi:xanthine dehydrogenase accessory protein XdhC [uncultured Tateyamaria sp.]|uniref:xanthine dehydrogenase accessory protein XdhC n=1 Tax=uncultured Tateyamaria sp. TaxID=455651 RepID=UPI00260C0649|nr:xanthine dehydrogenase accessory protein XdhC [uncultured Tateyamaria sp.]